jgi:hypothetical protein
MPFLRNHRDAFAVGAFSSGVKAGVNAGVFERLIRTDRWDFMTRAGAE